MRRSVYAPPACWFGCLCQRCLAPGIAPCRLRDCAGRGLNDRMDRDGRGQGIASVADGTSPTSDVAVQAGGFVAVAIWIHGVAKSPYLIVRYSTVPSWHRSDRGPGHGVPKGQRVTATDISVSPDPPYGNIYRWWVEVAEYEAGIGVVRLNPRITQHPSERVSSPGASFTIDPIVPTRRLTPLGELRRRRLWGGGRCGFSTTAASSMTSRSATVGSDVRTRPRAGRLLWTNDVRGLPASPGDLRRVDRRGAGAPTVDVPRGGLDRRPRRTARTTEAREPTRSWCSG